MHEDYDDEDYDDEDYYDYDNNDQYDPYKFYFKFDVGADSPISDMINKWFNLSQDSFNGLHWYSFPTNIDGWPVIKLPVSSWNPNTGKGNSFQYLGSNYQGSPIWKKQYFVLNKINNQYKLHVQSHASHFLKQPHYYNGMFDILN
jgi:hypothetical protein